MQRLATTEISVRQLKKMLAAISILSEWEPLTDDDKRMICSIKVKHGLM